MKIELIRTQVKFPADWIAAIDSVRGDQDFSEFVRECVLARLPPAKQKTLSPNPSRGLGGGRPPAKAKPRR